jgi:hypothetical protein
MSHIGGNCTGAFDLSQPCFDSSERFHICKTKPEIKEDVSRAWWQVLAAMHAAARANSANPAMTILLAVIGTLFAFLIGNSLL